MNKWLLRLLYAALVMAPIGAIADYTVTTGAGSTVFSFVCSATKICPAMVLIDSTNVEKATAGNPLRTDPTGTTTQPVSAATLPLPAGASTAAKQPALGTAGTASADVLTVQGIASMTALLVNGTGGTFPATQSGNWTTRIVGNAGTIFDFTGQNAPTPAASLLSGCQFNTTPTTIVSGNASPIQCDNAGNALVNIKAGTVAATQSGTWIVQPGNTANTTAWLVTGTGGTFPATQSGTWNITNVSGTVSLPTGAATSANQTNASQKTQIVDGSGNVIASTSNNLNVQCANCSGAGASAVDAASFTAGASVFGPSGGFFQTTPTSNPLTSGQQGMWQMTANRAGFVNLRNAAGTELGVAAAPLQVSVANTAANGTAMLVTGTGGTFPISGSLTANQSVNTAQVNGVTTLTGTGAVGTGAQRVAVGTDTATIAGSAPGTAGAASANVLSVQGIASMTKLLVTPDSVALPANQSVNVSQINGVTPLMGNGVTGTGSQRVTIASDNTAFAVNATLQATAATAIGTVNPTTAANWGIVAPTTATGSQAGVLSQGVATSAPPSYTTATINQLSMTTAGGLRTDTSSVAGATALVGAGATGSGSQRVTIAQDTTTVAGSASVPTGTNTVGKVGMDPAASAAVTDAVCTIAQAAAGGCPLKASAGNFYGAYALCPSACWLMVFNSATVPSNGATTFGKASGNLVDCIDVPAGGSRSLNYPNYPIAFSAGISVATSSTSCGTLTLAAATFIHGTAQ